MKASLKFILFLIVSIILVTSCSRKKDKFISRNFHALTTEFNILYNGYIALDEGKKFINHDYYDNYWDVLPIERLQIVDQQILLPGQTKTF